MQRIRRVGRSLALAAIIIPLSATAVLAAPTSSAHGTSSGSPSSTQSLMPMPSQGMDMSMPMPASTTPPATNPADGDGTSMAGMAGMTDSGESASTMPYIATPKAPQRHLTLAGFAIVNAGVLLAAGVIRRRQQSAARARSDAKFRESAAREAGVVA